MATLTDTLKRAIEAQQTATKTIQDAARAAVERQNPPAAPPAPGR